MALALTTENESSDSFKDLDILALCWESFAISATPEDKQVLLQEIEQILQNLCLHMTGGDDAVCSIEEEGSCAMALKLRHWIHEMDKTGILPPEADTLAINDVIAVIQQAASKTDLPPTLLPHLQTIQSALVAVILLSPELQEVMKTSPALVAIVQDLQQKINGLITLAKILPLMKQPQTHVQLVTLLKPLILEVQKLSPQLIALPILKLTEALKTYPLSSTIQLLPQAALTSTAAIISVAEIKRPLSISTPQYPPTQQKYLEMPAQQTIRQAANTIITIPTPTKSVDKISSSIIPNKNDPAPIVVTKPRDVSTLRPMPAIMPIIALANFNAKALPPLPLALSMPHKAPARLAASPLPQLSLQVDAKLQPPRSSPQPFIESIKQQTMEIKKEIAATSIPPQITQSSSLLRNAPATEQKAFHEQAKQILPPFITKSGEALPEANIDPQQTVTELNAKKGCKGDPCICHKKVATEKPAQPIPVMPKPKENLTEEDKKNIEIKKQALEKVFGTKSKPQKISLDDMFKDIANAPAKTVDSNQATPKKIKIKPKIKITITENQKGQ